MSIQRVALIYDDTVRADTTGTHCRSALEEFVDVVHFKPSELFSMPRDGFDLYLSIDDGLRYYLPDDLYPKAWWAIDTHMDFQWYNHRAPSFDFVFTAQRDGAKRLQENGIANVQWLPLACNPAMHQKHDVGKKYDICFVGNIAPGPREELLRLIQKHFPNVFIGQRYLQEMARTLSGSRIVFNCSVKDDLNMRVFEALACGSLLLTNALPDSGQDELFQDGVHLATYTDSEEMLHKIEYYLKHDNERERIAAAGREAALQAHTYRHRMEELLHAIEAKMVKNSQSAESKQNVGNNKNTSYFEFSRPELLALIPETAKQVLDVGCGAGLLGEALKSRQPATVVGIELDDQAAVFARKRLDEVYAGDAETLKTPFAKKTFDCIVCGDVLEHLRDPKKFLQKARSWLRDDGCLIASIPNIRHHSVIRSLLAGNWSYQSAGLLDDTHLHFFTRRDMVDLFRATGFMTFRWQRVPGPQDDEWQRTLHSSQLILGNLNITNVPLAEAAEYRAYQYLMVAVPTSHVNVKTAEERLGCILAVRNRPAEYLDRAFQTCDYQTLQAYDKVLVDYGSSAKLNHEYARLCEQYGWRLLNVEAESIPWSSAIAYNRAVHALEPSVNVVFKSDVDILLDEHVLEYAAKHGKDRLCVFSCYAATNRMTYPQQLSSPKDVEKLINSEPQLQIMDGEGICAFPRKWFTTIGGYDMNYLRWGFEDSDLRFRAEQTIGTHNVNNLNLVHQWHSRDHITEHVMGNYNYYQQMKINAEIVRNNGALLND